MTMTRRLAVFVLTIIVLSIAAAGQEAAAKLYFYVSPAGKDNWSGRLSTPAVDGQDGPFRTLQRARDAIRRLKKAGPLPAGGVEVIVQPGAYILDESFSLSAEDSGDEGAPVVYKAAETHKVRLLGGKPIDHFEPVRDPAILRRLDPAAHGKVLQADLKAQGLSDFGQLRPRGFGRPMYPAALELFFDGEPMQLARWPNNGWTRIASKPSAPGADRFCYEGDRPRRWLKATDIWVHGYWKWDWADSYERVQTIDPQRRQIITAEPHGVYGYTAGKRYYVLNLLEELDRPGEWYLDRSTGLLYFWPPKPATPGRAIVSVLEEPMISIRQASHVTFDGFLLECTRGTAVEIVGGCCNTIRKCIVRNIGNVAVRIEGGQKHGVLCCEISNTGDGGIILTGGDRKTLQPAGHYALNNHIHHYSRWCRTYRPAIRLSGVGNYAAHNLIHDGPHTAVLFGGNDHLLEFNEVHDVCYETGDVGAFYTGRDWTTRGTVIRYNYFHDIHGPYTHGAMSVYLDDAASGTVIFGNVFYKASRAAFIGGGRDNIVENNIFIQCDPAVHVDARSLTWAKKHIAEGGSWRMYRKLRNVAFDRPPYSTRYPKLARILEDDPAVPKGNIIRRNICVGGRWLDLYQVQRQWLTLEDNLVDTDPHFVDPARRDFRLRPDSPAFKLGFQQIPTDKIGLTDDCNSIPPRP